MKKMMIALALVAVYGAGSVALGGPAPLKRKPLKAEKVEVEDAVVAKPDFKGFVPALNDIRAPKDTGRKGGDRGGEKTDIDVNSSEYHILTESEWTVMTNAIQMLNDFNARQWTVIHSSSTDKKIFHGGFNHAEVWTNATDMTLGGTNYYNDGFTEAIKTQRYTPRRRVDPESLRSNAEKYRQTTERLKAELAANPTNTKLKVNIRLREKMQKRLDAQATTKTVNLVASPGKPAKVTPVEPATTNTENKTEAK